MPLQRRHSGGGGNALDLDQFQHLEEIAEDDNMMIDCCVIPKVHVLYFVLKYYHSRGAYAPDDQINKKNRNFM